MIREIKTACSLAVRAMRARRVQDALPPLREPSALPGEDLFIIGADNRHEGGGRGEEVGRDVTSPASFN